MEPASRPAPETDASGLPTSPITLASPPLGRPAAPGRWPRRRRLAAGGTFLVLVAAVQLIAGWDLAAAPAWSFITLATLAFSALALATFVPLPGHGRGLDVGCTPCAAGGGLLAVAGAWLAASSAYDGGTASLGLALAGAALVRRVTEPVTCQT